jgi:hypothetical protein
MANVTNQHQTPEAAKDELPDEIVVDTVLDATPTASSEAAPQNSRTEPESEKDSSEPKQFVDSKRNEIYAKARAAKAAQIAPFSGDNNDPDVLYGSNVGQDELGDLEKQALAREKEVQAEQANVDKPPPPKKALNGIDPDLLAQKVTTVVDGVAEEITVEEALRRAQMNQAADNRLTRASEILRQTQEFQRQLANQPLQNTGNDADQDDQNYDEHGEARHTSQTQLDAKGLAEKLQFGTPEEAAEVIRSILERAAPQAAPVDFAKEVQSALDSQKAESEVRSYAQKNPEIVQDPILQSTIVQFSHRFMAEDLLQAGLTMDQLRTSVQTPKDLSDLHKQARMNGMPVRSAQQILEAGHRQAVEWRTGKPNVQQQPQAQQVKVDLANRQQRKDALPAQPAMRRTAPMTPPSQPQTLEQKRSSAVAQMRKSRGQ